MTANSSFYIFYSLVCTWAFGQVLHIWNFGLYTPHLISLATWLKSTCSHLTLSHFASLRLQTFFFDPSLLPFVSVFSLFHVSISFYYDFFTFVMSIWHLHAPVFSLFHLHTSYNRNVQLQPKSLQTLSILILPFYSPQPAFCLMLVSFQLLPEKKKLQTPHLQMLMVQNMMLFFFLCVRGRC